MTLVMHGLGMFAIALATVATAPAAAAGQAPGLDRVDSLVDAGAYDEARDLLEEWWSRRTSSAARGADLAHGLMLRARLAPDPAAAESDYLGVVLGYPTSDHAPEALLRLGQGLLAEGDALRAAAYLERLVTDYPGQPQRMVGLLWLARANAAARRSAAACAAARNALQDARDPDLLAMLRVEAGASCPLAARTTSATATPATPAPASAEPDPPDRTTDPELDRDVGGWTVQTGAFRLRAGADALVDRLRSAGYSPRLVRVPRNDLLRVRVGRFVSSGEAAALVTRLRDDGFDAVVVNDAGQERQP